MTYEVEIVLDEVKFERVEGKRSFCHLFDEGMVCMLMPDVLDIIPVEQVVQKMPSALMSATGVSGWVAAS